MTSNVNTAETQTKTTLHQPTTQQIRAGYYLLFYLTNYQGGGPGGPGGPGGGGATFTVYFGTSAAGSQDTHFRTPTVRDYALKIDNTASAEWYINLETAPSLTASENGLVNFTANFNNMRYYGPKQLVVENTTAAALEGVTTPATEDYAGTPYTLATTATATLILNVTANSFQQNTLTVILKVATPTQTVYSQYTITIDLT